MPKLKPAIPKSCTSLTINIFAVVMYAITLYFLRNKGIKPFFGAIISIGILALTISILENMFLADRHRRSSGIDFSVPGNLNVRRVLIKLMGLYFTIALVAFFYWLFPEYNTGLYKQYFRLVYNVLPVILLGSIPYFFILDKYMKDPHDSHWHVGLVLLGRWKEADKTILKNHFLGWLVKAFFLALMFPALLNNTGWLMKTTFTESLNNFPKFYDFAYTFIFSVDLVYVCAGYLLTLKIFDSHIRSVEPSILGWIVALQCYQPFWSFTYKHYLNYDDNMYWGHVFLSSKFLYSSYGILILVLLAIYTLSSVVFGLRFSNLTNRGIITNGPYRWMKHPAYISKNLAWWLISVPFLSTESWDKAVQHSLLLLALNIIYYLRAVTEERHLSLDPTYVQYATALNARGIFKGLYKMFPFLKFDVNRYVKDGKIKKFLF